MKRLYFSIILVFFISGCTCFGQSYPEKVKLREIKILDSKIDSLLNLAIERTKVEILERYNSIVSLYLIEKDSNYHVYITIQSKKVYDISYHSQNLTMQGYCIVQNHDVLVLDKFYPEKMEFLNQEKTYVFLDTQKKERKKYPPPPPPISNSILFEYLLKPNGEVEQIK